MMDSTLLDQIRYLCRDRAAYEHLKAILVQQERVHKLSWEEQYEKLIAAKSSEHQSSDTFGNIIAREKALAQLADAIQRSPSLELVLQIAVQVAQKLLQVDRVAIFYRHPDGHGELATDAIAAGILSLANMPERQLSLARHMIESTNTEDSVQTVNSIRSSSLSSHIVNLLEQIGISSYVANKIYAGHEVWGTLVAFHGGAYHSWSESDRTSLSLIAAQIGIAISLTNLRQQSQDLTEDLQTLRLELDNLQQTVAEIAKSETKSSINVITNVITPPDLENEHNDNFEEAKLASDLAQVNHEEGRESENGFEEKLEETTNSVKEISGSEYLPIPENEVPPLLQTEDSHPSKSNLESEDLVLEEDIKLDEAALMSSKADFSNGKNLNNLKEFLGDKANLEEADAIEIEQHLSVAMPVEIPVEIPIPILGTSEIELIKPELSESEPPEIEVFEPKLIVETSEEKVEEEAIAPTSSKPDPIESTLSEQEQEVEESQVNQIDEPPASLETSQFVIADDDRDPAIEPQFIKTILAIAGDDSNATDFLLEVIDSYLKETPRQVQAIDKAIAINDHARLFQLLHTLRLSSDYIGALTLSYQCRQLESAVRANYVVLVYACLSQVAIEAHRATDALRIERSRYSPL